MYENEIAAVVKYAKSNSGNLGIHDTKFIENIWNQSFGTGLRVVCIIGPGGIGKTFSLPRRFMKKILYKPNYRGFVWFVENEVMQKDLLDSNGRRFLLRLYSWIEANKPNWWKLLCEPDINGVLQPCITTKHDNILFKGRVIGNILPVTKYSKLKGSNFICEDIVFDECIPERITFQTADYSRAFASALESIGRADDTKIYLAANPIRLKGGVLKDLQAENIQMGETRIAKLPNGESFALTHYIDAFQPKLLDFLAAKINSPAGSMALGTGNFYRLFGIPHLDIQIPLYSAETDGSITIRYSIIHNNVKLTFGQTSITNLLVVIDYIPTAARFCMYKQFVQDQIVLNVKLRESLLNQVSRGLICYQSVGHYEYLLNMITKN